MPRVLDLQYELNPILRVRHDLFPVIPMAVFPRRFAVLLGVDRRLAEIDREAPVHTFEPDHIDVVDESFADVIGPVKALKFEAGIPAGEFDDVGSQKQWQ